MITEYIKKALEKARYEKLEDGTWFAEIPGFQGVWANGKTVEETRNELQEVLEEWILLTVKDGEQLPKIGGVEIKIKETVTT